MRLCRGRETLWSEITVLRSLFRDLSPNPRITHCRFSLEALGLCCRFVFKWARCVTDSLRPVEGAGGSSLKSWRGSEIGSWRVPEWVGQGWVGSRDRPCKWVSCPLWPHRPAWKPTLGRPRPRPH